MPALTIPRSDYAGFEVIRKLDDDMVGKIVVGMGEQPVPGAPSEWASKVAGLVPELKPAEAESLASLVMSLYGLRTEVDQPVPALVDDIVDATSRGPYKDLNLSEQDQKHLRWKLEQLLGIGPLEVSMKGQSLAHDFENVYYRARIFSDIRPVFGADPASPPLTAVIVHTLKISYLHDEGSKDFYISMDDEDLSELRNVIERASAKDRSLQRILHSIETNEFHEG